MLHRATKTADDRGVTNIEWLRRPAEELAVLDGTPPGGPYRLVTIGGAFQSIECGGTQRDAAGPITLEPGQHVCLVNSEGYQEKVAIVTIEAGRPLKREVVLTEASQVAPSAAPAKAAAANTKPATPTKKTTAKKTSTQSTATKKSSKKTRSTSKAPTKTKPCGTFIPCK
jgi:hypothetical protein